MARLYVASSWRNKEQPHVVSTLRADGHEVYDFRAPFNGVPGFAWSEVKNQPDQVALAADYPVSHIDMGARHGALMAARPALAERLHDPDWPGDAKVAGWWLWPGRSPHAREGGRGRDGSHVAT